MKNVILTAAFSLFSAEVFAQTIKTNERGTHFGLKGGVNVSSFNHKVKINLARQSITVNLPTESVVGFNVTGYGNFGLGNNFFIQSGISLQNKGGKIEVVNSEFNMIQEQNIMAIEIPMNVLYNIPTGNVGAVQIGVGPYAAFNIFGKHRFVYKSEPNRKFEIDNLKFGNKNDDNLTHMDFGFNFSLGYMIYGVTIGANYGLGLMNMQPKVARTANERLTSSVLGVAVGYSF